MQIPDLSGNKASTGFATQCPPGWHLMRAAEVPDVPPNANGNSGIRVVWAAVGGEHDGAVCKDNFTLVSTSGANVTVGRERLKGLLGILGLPTQGQCDSRLIVGRVAMVKVVQKPWNPTPKPGEQPRTVQISEADGYRVASQAEQPQAAPTPQAAPVEIDSNSVPF